MPPRCCSVVNVPTLCALASVNTPLPNDEEGGDIAPLFAEGKGSVKHPNKAFVFYFTHSHRTS